MCEKFTSKFWIWILLLTGIAGFLIIFFNNDYKLNRTVRNIAMRMIQTQVLSRTTKVDRRLVFFSDRYQIFEFDADDRDWRVIFNKFYPSGIICKSESVKIFFSKGLVSEFRMNDMPTKVPRYYIVDFERIKSGKILSIIFYRSGDWKVI